MVTDTCGRCGVAKRINTEHDPFKCDGFTRKQLRAVKKRIVKLCKTMRRADPHTIDSDVLVELETLLSVITIPDEDEVSKPMTLNDRYGFEEAKGDGGGENE